MILECRDELMRDVIDHLGEEVETWVPDEEHFRVRAKVADSPTFYSWMFGFVGNIRIIEPYSAVKRYRQMLRKELK